MMPIDSSLELNERVELACLGLTMAALILMSLDSTRTPQRVDPLLSVESLPYPTLSTSALMGRSIHYSGAVVWIQYLVMTTHMVPALSGFLLVVGKAEELALLQLGGDALTAVTITDCHTDVERPSLRVNMVEL
jgi:hypothetical protein